MMFSTWRNLEQPSYHQLVQDILNHQNRTSFQHVSTPTSGQVLFGDRRWKARAALRYGGLRISVLGGWRVLKDRKGYHGPIFLFTPVATPKFSMEAENDGFLKRNLLFAAAKFQVPYGSSGVYIQRFIGCRMYTYIYMARYGWVCFIMLLYLVFCSRVMSVVFAGELPAAIWLEMPHDRHRQMMRMTGWLSFLS